MTTYEAYEDHWFAMNRVRNAVAVVMSVFHLYVLAFTTLSPWLFVPSHLAFILVLTFLEAADTHRGTAANVAFSTVGLVPCVYILWQGDDLLLRAGSFPTQLDLWMGGCLIVAILEATRRKTGPALPLIALLALLYAVFGNSITGMLGHRGYSLERLISYIYSLDGIFSSPLQISASYIFLFVLFGAFLNASGAGPFFLNLAMGALGTRRGGPAQVAVLGSALMGSISGSAVANTAATGAITIPMMKSIGYKPAFAAAVEAVASTGGQIMPPVMGAAVFILADIVGVSYVEVLSAALIPALLFFASVAFAVDGNAARNGLEGMGRDELPRIGEVVASKGHLILPLAVLIGSLLVLQVSPIRAALIAIVASIAATFFRKATWVPPSTWIMALKDGALGMLEVGAACACAGIVVGVLGLTGLGQNLAGIIISAADGNATATLILAMSVTVILGMGLPTTPAYIVASSVVAPALIGVGYDALSSHLFIFFYACLAVITPPIALASYTAASIAGSKPFATSIEGVKLGLTAFIIPYAFVQNSYMLFPSLSLGTLYTIATGLLGVFALSLGLQGWFFGRRNVFERGLLLSAAMLLLMPTVAANVLGIVVLGAAYLLTCMKRKSSI